MTTYYFPIFPPQESDVPSVFWPFTEADMGRYAQSISHGYKLRKWKPKFMLLDSWTRHGQAGVWSAGTYAVGDYVRPTVANGHIYLCVIAGATGGSEPTWGTTHEASQADGAVTWVCFPDNQVQAFTEFVDNRKGHVESFQLWMPIFSAWVKCKLPRDPISYPAIMPGGGAKGIFVEIEFEEGY